ncbi:MAG: hypothetical protein ACI8ZM_003847 [Crocinitomix sp.]|jgi:hypothetical protein
MQRIINYIIPINLVMDLLLVVTKNVAFIKAALMTALLVHLMIKYLGKHRDYNWIFVFGFYALIIALISTDLFTSLINTIKIIIPMFCILIGYHFFNTKEKIKMVANSMKITLIIIIINLAICTVLGIGNENYIEEGEEGQFLMGQLSDHWNMFTYSILTVPIILHFQTKRGKIYTAFLAFFNAILVILSIKRIAIIGLLGGGFINLFFTLSTKKIITFLSVIIIVVAVTFPLYSSFLQARFDARSDRFEEGSLEKESRLLETFYVWEDATSFKPVSKSLFGLEAFNSAGNYGGGRFGDRQLHVDYNNIVNTIGLVGLVIYLIVFIQLWTSFKFYLNQIVIRDKFSQTMKATFYTFFIIQFMTSLAGQMYNITFRMILFIFLGSAIGYFKQLKNRQIEGNYN